MKSKTINAAILMTALLCCIPVASSQAAESFHSGSTGKCEGCHGLGAGQGSTLRGSDASSTCLICHEPSGTGSAPQAHHVSSAAGTLQGGGVPTQLTPGGDFGWLKKSYSWRGSNATMEKSPGEMHGHSIVAQDYGYAASGTKSLSPGGSYPATALSCISCHDPHGSYRRNADGSVTTGGLPVIGSGSYDSSPVPGAAGSVGSYRLLAGKGYLPKTVAADAFEADPPAAVAPSSYNRSEADSDTRVAYGSGMSEWCQNCHPGIHGEGENQHVSGKNALLSAEITSNYNYYVKSGDLTGSISKSYSSLVPFEMGTDDYDVLKRTANSDGSDLSGPGASGGRPNVMCLSCHRAHASGWDSMTRWNAMATFMVDNGRYPGVDNGGRADSAQGRTEAEARRAYYDRPASRFATYQRTLCNKCHAKD